MNSMDGRRRVKFPKFPPGWAPTRRPYDLLDFPPKLGGRGGGGSQVDLFIPDWPTKNPTVFFFRRGKKLQSFLRGSLQSNYTSGRIDGYRHSLPSGDDL